MTKALGIDIGSSFIHLVELDGSGRRYKVSNVMALPRSGTPLHTAGELDSEEQPVTGSDHLAHDLERALAELPGRKERCILSVRGSACILRNFSLPFKGRDEIRKVLKFESEGQIHSHSIDEVVVDAAIVKEGDESTELFMAACPKTTLSSQLDVLQKHGVVPEKADLDCALLFQAAVATGAIGEAEENELDLIVGIGQSAVQLVLARGGTLQTSRVLRWGMDSLEHELAAQLNSDPRLVHDALHRYFELPTAQDFALPGEHIEEREEGEEDALEAHESLEHVEPEIGISVHEDEVRAAAQHLAQRLAREVFRFLAGLRDAGTLRSVVLTGGGARLPGIDQMLADELQVEVGMLDLMARTTGDESDPGLDTAFAAAMAGLGAIKPTMNFRQEELAFRRKFDRLKVPIAVLVWLLLGYVVLTCYNLTVQRKHLDWVVGVPRAEDPNRRTDTPRYTGLLENLGSPIRSSSWVLSKISDTDTAKAILEAMAKEETPARRLAVLKSRLEKIKRDLETSTGYFPEIELPSGLAVLQAFAELIERADKSATIGRFVVTRIDLDSGSRRPALSFEISFRGKDYRDQFSSFFALCREATQGGPKVTPFAEVLQKGSEEPFEDIDGARYSIELRVHETFEVFQPAKF
jgi:type IV pilus assembly protein PilM